MREELLSPLGLIAGNGSFPIEFAEGAKAKGLEVVAVAHQGETDPALSNLVSHCLWIKVGEIGKIIETFKARGVRQAAFAGGIKRVRLFGGVKLDLRAIALLARIRTTRDDKVLRGIAEELSGEGIEVISATRLLMESVPERGVLTNRKLTDEESQNAALGWDAAKAIGGFDIGQTVIVNGGVVVAVEAVEGTDLAIKRAGELSGPGGVVVKVSKPTQDLRFDLPTIGLGTVEAMKSAGCSALVLEAGKTVILDRKGVVELANRYRIAIDVR